MASDNELIRLEEYIERLLAGYSDLKKEKQKVEQKLAEFQALYVDIQAENEKMKQELDSLGSERGLMRDRVNSLIGQIEQWESEIGDDAKKDESDSEESGEDESETDPEDEEPPAAMKSKGDRGSKAQKKLFSG